MKISFNKRAFATGFLVCFFMGLLGTIILLVAKAEIFDAFIPLIAFIFFGLIFGFFCSVMSGTKISKPVDISQYKKYIEENKTSLGLFARPVYGKSKIVLANKFVIIEIDISNAYNNVFMLDITDKIKRVKHTVNVSSARTYKSYRSFKKLVNNIMNYDTVAEDIFYTLNRANMEQSEIKNFVIKDELLLDINQASEAELTALPGVTIAKAKHAIKVRNKQKLFLTMNQFYETIDLDEEFIEQIQTKGNKILLSELPEYKMLEMKMNE